MWYYVSYFAEVHAQNQISAHQSMSIVTIIFIDEKFYKHDGYILSSISNIVFKICIPVTMPASKPFASINPVLIIVKPFNDPVDNSIGY